jgi:hypothetical protein
MNVMRLAVVAVLLTQIFGAVPAALAQEAAATAKFKPEELEQIVAPIALHPDPLLAQILMASTYPLEIVQAARFMKDQPNLKGDQLAEALKQVSWDDSVKSLCTFPPVLTLLNEKLDWLQKLGDAVLGQQQEVMAAIQRLRARAQSEGTLKSTPEQVVNVQPVVNVETTAPAPATTQVVQAPPTVITIQPSDPQVIQVPSYNPTVVYGASYWPPAYPPYYPYPPGYFAAGAFTFMAGMAVGGAIWGDCDWGNGDININNQQVNNFSNRVNHRTEANQRIQNRESTRRESTRRESGRQGAGGERRSSWNHDPGHRKGVQYRDSATQQRFNRGASPTAANREAFRGRAEQGGLGGAQSRQAGGFDGARGGQSGGFAGASQTRQAGGFAGGDSARARPEAAARGGGAGAAQGRQSGAFDGMGRGSQTQSFSDRGHASRQSFQQSAGSRGGGSGMASPRSSGGAPRASAGGGGGARAGGGGGGRGGGRR